MLPACTVQSGTAMIVESVRQHLINTNSEAGQPGRRALVRDIKRDRQRQKMHDQVMRDI
jgi:hypothetical protein